MQYTDIRFPGLGITLHQVGRSVFIGNFEIMYYGMIIALAFLLGYLMVSRVARASGQNPDIYLDYLLWMMIPSIIGARAYYVVFSGDYYGEHPAEILNLRQGGLGIVGGVLMAILVLVLFARIRKQNPFLMLDTLTMGLLLGQIIGRWGNFFNREAFGSFCNGPLAMQIPVEYFRKAGRIAEIQSTGLLDQLVYVTADGGKTACIQVHPTFLYEGLGNLALLLFILFWRKKKTFDGELLCIYMMGYGVIRFLVESLRVDQLTIGDTGIAVTQVVCAVSVMLGAGVMLRKKRREA